jgi:mRNA-degrading endonuclease toxin of MazEF toxin-antitoxin module
LVARGEVRWLELEEVAIGPADGMPIDCVISLDNLRTLPPALLIEPITKLDARKRDALCKAVILSAGC